MKTHHSLFLELTKSFTHSCI